MLWRDARGKGGGIVYTVEEGDGVGKWWRGKNRKREGEKKYKWKKREE